MVLQGNHKTFFWDPLKKTTIHAWFTLLPANMEVPKDPFQEESRPSTGFCVRLKKRVPKWLALVSGNMESTCGLPLRSFHFEPHQSFYRGPFPRGKSSFYRGLCTSMLAGGRVPQTERPSRPGGLRHVPRVVRRPGRTRRPSCWCGPLSPRGCRSPGSPWRRGARNGKRKRGGGRGGGDGRGGGGRWEGGGGEGGTRERLFFAALRGGCGSK